MMMNLRPYQGPKEGEDITIKEIKKAVEKAIQVLSSKLNPSDRLMEDLSIAYAALEE